MSSPQHSFEFVPTDTEHLDELACPTCSTPIRSIDAMYWPDYNSGPTRRDVKIMSTCPCCKQRWCFGFRAVLPITGVQVGV